MTLPFRIHVSESLGHPNICSFERLGRCIGSTGLERLWHSQAVGIPFPPRLLFSERRISRFLAGLTDRREHTQRVFVGGYRTLLASDLT
jgi:hypothetical protein